MRVSSTGSRSSTWETVGEGATVALDSPDRFRCCPHDLANGVSDELRVSWSALRNFEECRQRWRLVSTGRKSPTTDIRNYFPGTVVDRVMRAWLNQDDPRPGEMPTMVDEFLEREEANARESGDGVVRWRGRNDRAVTANFCRELVTRLEPILYEYVVPFEYQPAVRFRAPVTLPGLDDEPRTVMLVGEVDVVTRDVSGDYRAYDLKATQDEGYVKKTLGQSVFYDLSMGEYYGTNPVEFAFIQPMCKQRVVHVKITNDSRMEMVTRIVKMAHAVWRQEWETLAEDAGECFNCPVKHACPKFQPVPGSVRRASLAPRQ